MKRAVLLTTATLVASCVYYNAMYDIEQAYDRAVDERRADRRSGGNIQYDSVIAKADRLIRDHPESEHAARAAILKARSELARNQPESAAATASKVAGLTEDPSLRSVASGLEGVARREMGEQADAERLLTQALEGQPSAEDRALFHFHRGLSRLEAGDADGATDDLALVSAQDELTVAVRLDLARGLIEVGQFTEAVALTAELVAENRFANFDAGMDANLDSLARHAPEDLEAAFGEQLADTDVAPTKLALLHYYRGLAREVTGDRETALARYDSAAAAADRGRYAAQASYRWARLRILDARRPADIVATREALARGATAPDPKILNEVRRLRSRVDEFAELVAAYETRGASAAEAALRAAEIAGADLGSRRVARGLYLTYLDLAPDSPWRAKAIAGAMLHADWPAGEWAGDRGEATDSRLRTQLAGLPNSNPYRVSLQDLPRTPGIDSAYVEAERELRRRLLQIRMLYDTTAVLVDPSGAADGGDEAAPQQEQEAQEDEPEVEF